MYAPRLAEDGSRAARHVSPQRPRHAATFSVSQSRGLGDGDQPAAEPIASFDSESEDSGSDSDDSSAAGTRQTDDTTPCQRHRGGGSLFYLYITTSYYNSWGSQEHTRRIQCAFFIENCVRVHRQKAQRYSAQLRKRIPGSGGNQVLTVHRISSRSVDWSKHAYPASF